MWSGEPSGETSGEKAASLAARDGLGAPAKPPPHEVSEHAVPGGRRQGHTPREEDNSSGLPSTHTRGGDTPRPGVRSCTSDKCGGDAASVQLAPQRGSWHGGEGSTLDGGAPRDEAGLLTQKAEQASQSLDSDSKQTAQPLNSTEWPTPMEANPSRTPLVAYPPCLPRRREQSSGDGDDKKQRIRTVTDACRDCVPRAHTDIPFAAGQSGAAEGDNVPGGPGALQSMDYGSRRSQVHAPSDSMRQQHGGSTEEGTVHGGGRTGACHSDDEAVADLAREGHCLGDASDGCALGNGVHRRPRTAEKSLESGSPGALKPEVASGGPVADVGVGVCARRGFTWKSTKWDHMPKEEVPVDVRLRLLALPLLTPMEWLTDTINGISDDEPATTTPTMTTIYFKSSTTARSQTTSGSRSAPVKWTPGTSHLPDP